MYTYRTAPPWMWNIGRPLDEAGSISSACQPGRCSQRLLTSGDQGSTCVPCTWSGATGEDSDCENIRSLRLRAEWGKRKRKRKQKQSRKGYEVNSLTRQNMIPVVTEQQPPSPPPPPSNPTVAVTQQKDQTHKAKERCLPRQQNSQGHIVLHPYTTRWKEHYWQFPWTVEVVRYKVLLNTHL